MIENVEPGATTRRHMHHNDISRVSAIQEVMVKLMIASR